MIKHLWNQFKDRIVENSDKFKKMKHLVEEYRKLVNSNEEIIKRQDRFVETSRLAFDTVQKEFERLKNEIEVRDEAIALMRKDIPICPYKVHDDQRLCKCIDNHCTDHMSEYYLNRAREELEGRIQNESQEAKILD
jgi:hypothetical protein